MSDWVDESPARYGEIKEGTFGPFPFGGRIHFVRFHREWREYRGSPPGWIVMPPANPDAKAACGEHVPDDWRWHPERFPIAGTVDCPGCLKAMEEDESGDG